MMMYYEELKYLAGVNILECLKKTRDVQDSEDDKKFIQVCFWFLRQQLPGVPEVQIPDSAARNMTGSMPILRCSGGI
jgi:hypothetical protein